MGIGQRHQVQIIPYTSAVNGSGSQVETPGTAIGVWAEISNPSGFEAFASGQSQIGITKDFLIRYRFNAKPNVDWRIRYEGKLWGVTSIIRLQEKKFYYRLTATSRADA